MTGLLLFSLLLADAPAQPTAGAISFRTLADDEDGISALLEKRRADVTQRGGGKLGSHDWWLWGLTPVDYDQDGDPDFLVTVHGPTRRAPGRISRRTHKCA